MLRWTPLKMTSGATCMRYFPVGLLSDEDRSEPTFLLGGVGFRDGSSYEGRVPPLAAAEFPLMAWSAREVPRSFCCWVRPASGFALSGHIVALSSARAPKGIPRAAEI